MTDLLNSPTKPIATPTASERAPGDRHLPTRIAAIVSLVLAAAIFGFFYAWICSTMWGLDLTDPRVAIEAMQAMNTSVRNPVFFVSFFLTPVAWGVAALLGWQAGLRRAAILFAVAGAIYLTTGLILTTVVNVPMNEALGRIDVPADLEAARQVWAAYSPTWQGWNIARTVTSGISFVVGLFGFGEVMRHAGSPASLVRVAQAR